MGLCEYKSDTLERLYDYVLDESIFTEDELNIVLYVGGNNKETYDKLAMYKFGYCDIISAIVKDLDNFNRVRTLLYILEDDLENYKFQNCPPENNEWFDVSSLQ